MRISYELRCGCGTVTILKRLNECAECASCGWPLVYARDVQHEADIYTISRHADLEIHDRRTTQAESGGKRG